MQENFEVFDFELSAEDMAKIIALDTKSVLIFKRRNPENVISLINYNR